MTEIIHHLDQLDAQLLLFINGIHCSYADQFMMLFSNRFVWIPLYASFLYVLLRNLPWQATLSTCVCIALLVLLCDQTASGILKPLVERMRPSNPDNPISPLVHIVNGYRGGPYGFPSSHAANSWGLAFFAMYLARNRKLTLFLGIWAFLMSYSRAYLGVHYPGDLLVGFLIALLWSSLVYYMYKKKLPSHVQMIQSPSSPLRGRRLPILTGMASILAMLIASGIMC